MTLPVHENGTVQVQATRGERYQGHRIGQRGLPARAGAFGLPGGIGTGAGKKAGTADYPAKAATNCSICSGTKTGSGGVWNAPMIRTGILR